MSTRFLKWLEWFCLILVEGNCYEKDFQFINLKLKNMKTKNYFITMAMILLSMVSTQAQTFNGDFETLTPSFFTSYWGYAISIPISGDVETGVFTEDFIQYSNCWSKLAVPSFTPHNGQYALEISNALNVTQNQVIPGGAFLFNDANSDIPGCNIGMPLEGNVNINQLGFYYKFAPAAGGNNIAEAVLEVYGDSGVIGRASITISQATDVFQYVYAPVEFTSTETPTYMTILFNMAKEGSTPTFGTILTVDDVTLNNAALHTNSFESGAFAVFPTITRDAITIQKGKATDGDYAFKIINTEGRIVKEMPLNFSTESTSKVDVSNLSKGVYFLQTQTDSGTFVTKFVKQ